MSYIPRTENVNPRTENVNILKTMEKKAAALKKKAEKKLGKIFDKPVGTDSGVQSEQSLKAHGKQFIHANQISNT